jgi:acyl-CoA synthetase (AMP-forming)/AMP-acid ligase II/acyl carrier protein
MINDMEISKKDSIVSQFERAVNLYSHHTAIKTRNGLLTYSQLNNWANRIAFDIQKLKTQSFRQGVAILLDRDLSMFSSIIGVLKTGLYFVCLDIANPQNRLEEIVIDSKAGIIITDSCHYLMAKKIVKKIKRPVKILKIEKSKKDNDSNDNPNIHIYSDQDAFLIYTSGTTGKPKGIMHAHKNIVFGVKSFKRHLKYCSSDVFAYFYHPCFVMGVLRMFEALFSGASLVVLSPSDKNINQLKQNKITVWSYVPHFFRNFIDLLGKSEYLSHVRVIALGGAPVTRKDFELFKRHFSTNCLFVNSMGSSEFPRATINVMTKKSDFLGDRVPVGKLLEGVKAEAGFKKQKKERELILRSDFFLSRYWNRNDDEDRLSLLPSRKGIRFKTGDIVKFLADGTIKLLGRKDDQAKIGGQRVELSEIESSLCQHKDVEECVAFIQQDQDGFDQISIFYVSCRPIREESLRSWLVSKLPLFMIPKRFIFLKSMPFLSNGKPDRLALKTLVEKKDTKRKYEPPTSDTQRKIANIWQEVLSVKKIGINDNFFELGGHSLKAMMVVAKMRQKLKKQIELKQIFKNPTVRRLAAEINKASRVSLSIPLAKKKKYYRLSRSQIEFWRFGKENAEMPIFNAPTTLRIRGDLNAEILVKTLTKIVNRQESLRTNFVEIKNEPVQKIRRNAKGNILKIINLKRTPIEQKNNLNSIIEKETARLFNLKSDALFRFNLVKLKNNEFYLILVFHHLIIDRWSVSVFLKELEIIYNCLIKGKEISLESLSIKYKDYADWEYSKENRDILAKQEKYWINQFKDGVLNIKLPSDNINRLIKGNPIGAKSIEIGKIEAEKIRRLCNSQGTTLFSFMFSVFGVFLHKITGQCNILIKTPCANRNNERLNSIMGLFVSIMVLKSNLKKKFKFNDFLKANNRMIIDGLANSNYSYSRLIEKMSRVIDNKNISAEIFFQLFDETGQDLLRLDGINVDIIRNNTDYNHYDLKCIAVRREEKLIVNFFYNKKIFKQETAGRWLDIFYDMLKEIIANPKVKILDL